MKFQRSTHHPRVTAGLLALLFALALLPTAPRSVTAQQVAGGDFDICDYCGSLVANTMHLRGRPGFGTNLGQFVLINAANDAQDVDRDGWASGVNFTNLFVQQVSDFINAAQPSNTIGASNFVPLPVHQSHRERLEGPPCLECLDRRGERRPIHPRPPASLRIV